MNRRDRLVQARYWAARDHYEDVGLSTVTLFELEFGISNSRRQGANRDALAAFLSDDYKIFPFDVSDVPIAAEIRARLKSLGTPIGPYDLLIAAQAVRLDATLVTANTREFARVPDMKLEDWTLPA